MSGVTSFCPTKRVGIQYADESLSDSQLLLPPMSEADVVSASTDRFPMYVWLCERPGCRGNTTGSSLLRWLKLHPIA